MASPRVENWRAKIRGPLSWSGGMGGGAVGCMPEAARNITTVFDLLVLTIP